MAVPGVIIPMSSNRTHSAEDAMTRGFIVAAPRSSDAVSGALRAAFGRPADGGDDFSAILRQIDIADRDRLPR